MTFTCFLTALITSTLISTAHADRAKQPSCKKEAFVPYRYAGCFFDRGHNWIMGVDPLADWGDGLAYNSASTLMTPETCTAFCKGNNYRFAGLKQHGECWCGTDINYWKADENRCVHRCTSDPGQMCGGDIVFSVFEDPTYPEQINVTDFNSYIGLGCWGVELSYPEITHKHPWMTIATCLVECKSKGFPFAFLGFADHCYCDVNITPRYPNPDGTPRRFTCKLPCRGDYTETCGSFIGGPSVFYAPDMVSTHLCVSNGVELISDIPDGSLITIAQQKIKDAEQRLPNMTAYVTVTANATPRVTLVANDTRQAEIILSSLRAQVNATAIPTAFHA